LDSARRGTKPEQREFEEFVDKGPSRPNDQARL